ncbi:methyltransferase, partial [Vibrio parahaemolyticus]
AEIGGRVADLGAGWGYLSCRLLDSAARPARLDLYEAEAAALAAARTNLAPLATRRGVPVGFHWADVTAGLPAAAHDWVLMNPPFHD